MTEVKFVIKFMNDHTNWKLNLFIEFWKLNLHNDFSSYRFVLK